jgi:hypothetical protein
VPHTDSILGLCVYLRYWLALLIALAINVTLFAKASVDTSSSYGCTLHTGCRHHTVFHWITQSWSPHQVSRVFGLVMPGPVALAVRILTILHFLFSSILFIGWLVRGCQWECPSLPPPPPISGLAPLSEVHSV